MHNADPALTKPVRAGKTRVLSAGGIAAQVLVNAARAMGIDAIGKSTKRDDAASLVMQACSGVGANRLPFKGGRVPFG